MKSLFETYFEYQIIFSLKKSIFFSETMGYVKQLRAGVVFVDEIPRLSTGKLDRKYFKQLVSNEVIKNDSKIFIQ